MPGVSDVTEIGDFWVGGAWAHFELSRYRQAAEICDEGLSAIAGRAPNVEIHIRAWRMLPWDAVRARSPLSGA